MLFMNSIQTDKENFHNITGVITGLLEQTDITHGICTIFCPHTTAGITINENADPDVIHDMLLGLETTFCENPAFRHAEGNSTAHLKASCIGSSQTIIIYEKKLLLGTWQGIYFCEFDGPRERKFFVHFQKAN
ncbi:MAG: secondary thiamine-phosphate synthase enzyme YjbQ [Treponemataceae bacterium]